MSTVAKSVHADDGGCMFCDRRYDDSLSGVHGCVDYLCSTKAAEGVCKKTGLIAHDMDPTLFCGSLQGRLLYTAA